jgi:predicted permease
MATSEALNVVDQLKRDALYGIRQLIKAPSFAMAAIATLALGIGATAGVFSVVNAVVLRPLPFADADRVVNLHPARDGAPLAVASNLELATWRQLPRVFDAVAGVVSGASFTLTRGDAPEVVTGGRVTSEFSRVFGVTPAIGRSFTPTDDQPGAPRVVMLSHALWLRAFNADRGALGQSLRLDGEQYTVIGVMPASFDLAGTGDQLWVPLALSSTDLQDFRRRYVAVTARLAPGVSLEQATSAVDVAERALAAQNPIWGNGYTGQVRLYSDDMVGNLRSRLFILLGAVSFVFLIACVNVANLLMARGSARAREMTIRAALGAERHRLLRQLLTESGVLAAVGAACGVALAFGFVRGLVAASPPNVPRIGEARVDGVVLLFVLVISTICSVLVGLLPALRSANPALAAVLRQGARGVGESQSRERARAVLVVGEVALAMALLTGAGLLLRTAWKINHVDPGFDGNQVVTARILVPPARYADLASGARAYRELRDAVARIPGMQAVSLTSAVPLSPTLQAGVGAEGQPMTDGARLITAVRMISPGYFATLRIRMLAGRDFTEHDDANGPLVAIINETMAKKFWPGEQAIGKRIEGMDPSHRHFMEVVGVIADPRNVSLDQTPAPEFYIPFEQMPPALWGGIQASMVVVVRTAAEPNTVERSVRRAVNSVDPTLPIVSVAAMETLVRSSRASARFNTLLLSVFGVVALMLASVGVYGVVAYSLSQRTREIALRMAMGATPSVIAVFVIRRAFAPVIVGTVAGVALSLATTRLLRDQLYGVEASDLTTLLGVTVLLLAVSVVAVCVPSWRAMRVSPARALAGA